MSEKATNLGFKFLGSDYAFILLLVMMSGIIVFNRSFTHLAFHNVFITEFLLINILLVLVTVPQFYRQFLSKKYLLFFAFITYGILQFALNSNYSFIALRHSLIIFYGIFMIVFLFAFNNEKKIRFFLLYSLLISTFLNCPKILYYLLIGKTYAYESYRILHSEVDVICASLSMIGLLIFHNEFIKRSRIFYILLMLLNTTAIIFTVKRSALMGLVLVVILLILLERKKGFYQHLASVSLSMLAIGAIFVVGFYLYSKSEFNNILDFALGKLKYAEDPGSAWRLIAWKHGWEKFLNAPVFGCGFGWPILERSVKLTTTQDPHNSFLAFLIRNGLIGTVTLISLLVQTLILYIKMLTSPSKEGDKPLILFFLLGFIFMLNYAFFNVVLENQYEGIFFWFMLSGVYIAGNLKAANVPLAASTNRITKFACGFSIIFIITYTILLFSPWNYVKSISIYDAKIGAQIPTIFQEYDTKDTTFNSSIDGLVVDSISEQDGWSALLWVLPESLPNLKGSIKKYAISLTLAEPIEYLPSFALFGKHGEKYAADNPVIYGRSILIYLKDLGDIDWDNVQTFSVDLPYKRHSIHFTVEKLEIKRTDS